MDRSGPVAQLRSAVRSFADAQLPGDAPWCVALSGGADSLALTAVAAVLRPTRALIVDHGLQDESAAVAETARGQALVLGCVDAQVLRVQVSQVGGPEAAARTARYTALESARAGAVVLLAHTLDDQAVTIRERDTMQQERVALDKVADYVAARIGEKHVRYPQLPVEMRGEAWPESVKIAEAGGLY